MNRLSPTLIKKLANKLDKSEKYVREQISKRARRERIYSEAALANWADELNIPISSYTRSLPQSQQTQIYSHAPNNSGNAKKIQSFRIVKIGGDENRLYNQHNINDKILVIGIHPGSSVQAGMINKRWDKDNFVKVADILYEKLKCNVLIFGGSDEHDLKQYIYDKMNHKPIANDNSDY